MAPIAPFPPGAGWIERTCFENALHISSIPAERERGSRSSEAFHLFCQPSFLLEMLIKCISYSHCFTYGTFSLVLIECT